jgi:beta-lactamase class A
MRATLLAVAGFLMLGHASPRQAVAPLDATIRARLDSLTAQSSFYARQVSSGREIAIRADVPMNTASVIKIPVMILAFRDADAGTLNLEERYTIRAEDVRRGTGLLQNFTIGLQPTYHDLITQMIITSDNTATDIMIAKVGRVRVNRLLDSLGYRQTRLQGTVGQAFTTLETYPGKPGDSTAAQRNFSFVMDSAQWLGRTTAREISRLLEQIERGELASTKSTTDMRRILRQQVYVTRLPQLVRLRVTIGHKTGDWPPYLANDVGIMYVPAANGGPIVISVFTNANRGSFFDVELTEGRIAEDVFNAWGK